MKNNKFANFALLMLLACCWGPSFLFIKVALEYFEPITLTLYRVGVAAILLHLILRFSKVEFPDLTNYWRHFLFLGIVGSALPFTLFNFAEQTVSSSLASIFNGMVPLMTIIIAHFATKDDQLTKNKFWGATLGFVGLAILVAPKFFGVKATIVGIIMLMVAVSCYSVAFVYSRRYIQGLNPLISSVMQLSFAALILLPFSIIFESPARISDIPAKPVIALLSLSVLGTSFAFILLYKIIELTSASYVSMVNYIIPVIGILLGVVVLHESLSWSSVVGCLVIMSGVMTANGIFKRKKVK